MAGRSRRIHGGEWPEWDELPWRAAGAAARQFWVSAFAIAVGEGIFLVCYLCTVHDLNQRMGLHFRFSLLEIV